MFNFLPSFSLILLAVPFGFAVECVLHFFCGGGGLKRGFERLLEDSGLCGVFDSTLDF